MARLGLANRQRAQDRTGAVVKGRGPLLAVLDGVDSIGQQRAGIVAPLAGVTKGAGR